MAADYVVDMRLGEKRPIYGTFTAPTGSTLTISPTPTFTLYDSTNTAVTGLSALNVTGYNSSALLAPQAWYLFDTTSPVVLAAGLYLALINGVATGSDGMVRDFEPTIIIRIWPKTS